MRLDQFLRYSRLVKRRPLAKSLADGGCVEVEGKAARASRRVEVGDVLRVRFDNRTLRVRVLGEATRQLPKKEATSLYEVLEEATHAREEPAEAPSGGTLDFLKRD